MGSDEELADMKFIDHTDVVKAIRAQNWKLGGALVVDVPKAETMVFNLMQEAAKIIHERCLVAAENAVSQGRSREMVIEAVRNISVAV